MSAARWSALEFAVCYDAQLGSAIDFAPQPMTPYVELIAVAPVLTKRCFLRSQSTIEFWVILRRWRTTDYCFRDMHQIGTDV